MEEEKYDIKFTPIAKDDLEKVYSYISKDLFAAQAADYLMDKIDKGLSRISDFPRSCPLSYEKVLANNGYYMLIIDNYILYYIIDDFYKTILIMRVIYRARDIHKHYH